MFTCELGLKWIHLMVVLILKQMLTDRQRVGRDRQIVGRDRQIVGTDRQIVGTDRQSWNR